MSWMDAVAVAVWVVVWGIIGFIGLVYHAYDSSRPKGQFYRRAPPWKTVLTAIFWGWLFVYACVFAGVAEGTHWVLKRTVFLWLEKLSTKLEHVFTSAFPPSDDLGD